MGAPPARGKSPPSGEHCCHKAHSLSQQHLPRPHSFPTSEPAGHEEGGRRPLDKALPWLGLRFPPALLSGQGGQRPRPQPLPKSGGERGCGTTAHGDTHLMFQNQQCGHQLPHFPGSPQWSPVLTPVWQPPGAALSSPHCRDQDEDVAGGLCLGTLRPHRQGPPAQQPEPGVCPGRGGTNPPLLAPHSQTPVQAGPSPEN